MKTRYVVLITGLLSLFVSTTSLAHDGRQNSTYAGPGFSSGVVVWDASYAYAGYVGTLSYGVSNAYAYIPAHGQVYRSRHDHAWRRDHKGWKKHRNRHDRHHGHHRDHRSRDQYRHR